MKTLSWIVPLYGILATCTNLSAELLHKEVRERAAAVEGIRNEQAGFVVRVDVDHQDRIYVDGDTLQATVKSHREGYLYLLYLNAAGETVCLFPNRYQADNRIQANQAVQVPASGANFRIRIQQPVGREVLKAIVSLKPLSASDLSVKSLTEGVAKEISERGVRGAAVELATTYQARDWAEHQVELTTVTRRGAAKQASRYGAIVAVAKHQDPNIRPLPACAKDTELMKKVFQTCGRMDDVVVLQDEQATRANVEKLFKILAQGTKPGDEIFIYWTGHGASVADVHGDSADGDEVLVAHDASRDDVGRTGVLDDVLGRWVQDLDRRRVVFVLDVCLAGGFAGKGVSEKSLFGELKGQEDPSDAASAKRLVHFFESKFAQIKSIDQKETALLCSSSGKEVSLVRRDGASSRTRAYVRSLDRAQSPMMKGEFLDFELVSLPRAVVVPPREKPPLQPRSELSRPMTPGSEITNTIGMKLRLIPAGEFMMGSPADEKDRSSSEGPVHRVRITKPFYLGVYEVTQGEYEQIMGKNPSGFNGSTLPVEQVSWEEAVEFCKKLSAKEGQEYRLPTEAEWEYACRAGTTTPFSFGGVLDGQDANVDGSVPYGTETKGPYKKQTTPVGSYRANPFEP